VDLQFLALLEVLVDLQFLVLLVLLVDLDFLEVLVDLQFLVLLVLLVDLDFLEDQRYPGHPEDQRDQDWQHRLQPNQQMRNRLGVLR
jgi:hypothetical protein